MGRNMITRKNNKTNKNNRTNNDNRTNKNYGTSRAPYESNEDRVLRTAVAAVIVLFLLGALIVGIKSLNPRPDTTEGEKKLAQMERTDLGTVEQELEELDAKEAAAQEEKDKRPNSEKFENTLILGDYIAQGLYEQEVLGESFVLASEDASVAGMDDAQMITNLEAAAKQKPKVLFLMLGINDVTMEGGSADTFEGNYRAFLERVTEKLPDAKIFVNSILPVTEEAAAETSAYANIPEYNKRLQALCKEAGAIYIDNDSLVKDEYYKDDGTHMKKKFYKLWAKQMATAADL